MKQFMNEMSDIDWILDTHLSGVPLPQKWKGFKSFVLYGSEDCPDKLELYLQREPAEYDSYFGIVFVADGAVYCECKEVVAQ